MKTWIVTGWDKDIDVAVSWELPTYGAVQSMLSRLRAAGWSSKVRVWG